MTCGHDDSTINIVLVLLLLLLQESYDTRKQKVSTVQRLLPEREVVPLLTSFSQKKRYDAPNCQEEQSVFRHFHYVHHPSQLHSFTPGSELAFSVNTFYYRLLVSIKPPSSLTGLKTTYPFIMADLVLYTVK